MPLRSPWRERKSGGLAGSCRPRAMSRWRPWFVSVQPGSAWPWLVTRQQVFLAAKTAVAAGLAWVAALAADPHSRPYFAPLAVLLVVQPTVYDSLSRAFQRVAGVVVGVAAALTVSHFLAPDAWSIGIIIFAGLLLGWAARLGPQGAVQVPVSALLVFLVGRATPGYGGERIVDTLIGAGPAVNGWRSARRTRRSVPASGSPSTPGRWPGPWLTDRTMPIRCRPSAQCSRRRHRPPRPTPCGWPQPARQLTASVWPKRSALQTTPSAARSPGSSNDRGSDPAQWLTFGMTLAMSQRILAEVGRPLDPAEREPA